MRKLLPVIAALVLSAPAFSADNAVVVTAGSGITMKSKDVGAGVQSMQPNLIDSVGAEILGLVTASPAANTIGARLVTINTTLGTPLQAGGNIGTVTALTGITNALPAGSNIIGNVRIDQTTPGTTNGVTLSGTNNIATVTTVTTVSTLTGGAIASGSADSGNPLKIGGKYNSTPITLTDGQRGDLQLDANGYVAVNVKTATGLAQGSTTSGQTGSLVMGAVTTNTPTYTTAQTSPLSLDTNGGLRTSHILATTSGWTTKLLNGLTNSAVAIKASGGQVAKVYCYNPNASVTYIQVYNVAQGSVTVGTTSPAQSYGIPPTNSSGYTLSVVGDQFGTAISAAATTTVAGASAPASALDCNVSYN